MLTPLSLALMAPAAVHAAAFLPGTEPDAPTGQIVSSPVPVEPAGTGIVWRLAPWQVGGTLALDLRSTRTDSGGQTRQGLLLGDIDFASFVWQPWFIQVRFGLGWIATTGSDGLGGSSDGLALTGRAAVSVFPASRFPFELRADVSDSRTAGPSFGGEYRSQRISASQSWRPEMGNANVRVNVDRSVITNHEGDDTLTVLNANANHQQRHHVLDLAAMHSEHQRSDDELRTLLSSLSARHGFVPSQEVQVDTLASWNEARIRGAGQDTATDLRQLSSFATWRVGRAARPTASVPMVTASARWSEAQARVGGSETNRAQTLNATLGVSHELSAEWRYAVSGSASRLDVPGGSTLNQAGGNATLGWSARSFTVAGWRYTPSATTTASYARDSTGAERKTVGAQLAHGLAREFAVGQGTMISLAANQGAAVLRENQRAGTTRAWVHGGSIGWQSADTGGSQSYGALSFTDSRNYGASEGHAQLVNLQISQRVQLGRYSTWAVSFTAQGNRNASSEVDAFTGELRQTSSDWQPFYGATASYHNYRAFGVPRLQLSVLASANSQIYERRSLGDIDAPRERVTESLEARLDYRIGRLETRLSAQAARVDGRSVMAVHARAQRSF